MSDKSSGIDFDRQVFVQSNASSAAPSAARTTGLIISLLAIAAIVFLGYKLLPQLMPGSSSNDAPAMSDIDKRLSQIESRLEKLEATRRAAPVAARKDQPAAEQKQPVQRPLVKTVYQVSSASSQPSHVSAGVAAPDQATTQRLVALQQRLGALQTDQTATREAWEATTDKLADMAGQVGSQSVEILKSQDQLNQLLSRTEMEAIPFELLKGSNPQPVGPASFVLKSANPKTQRYTVCVYVQPACIELKDRTLHEVVQFVTSRNTTPLEMIVTKIVKDEVVGYLEVPRDQSAQ